MSLLALVSCSALGLQPALNFRSASPVLQQQQLSRSHAIVMEQQRWSDPILDDSIPDPVFENDLNYKGRVSWGFSNTAEKLNGRVVRERPRTRNPVCRRLHQV